MKEYRRNFMKMYEENYNIATKKIINNNVFKVNIPGRKRHPKKVKITRERMVIIRRGLVDIFKTPINEQKELIKFKNYKENSIKISKVNHNKTMNQNLHKNILKANMPTNEMHNTMLMTCLLYTSRCV